jgi:hypothetical protein
MKRNILICLMSLGGLPICLQAQNFHIDWSKISGGGGVSTNGQFSLSGTVGQHDAGATMNGGNYSVAGGFWSGISLVQTLGAPQLSIQFSGGNAIISWAADKGSGFSLQEATTLNSPAPWGPSSATLSTNGNTISATVLNSTGFKFFRLRKP